MAHRDFLTIIDLGKAEAREIFSNARTYKEGTPPASLRGKSVVLLFEKASTRTRISFEVGVARLGGHPIVLTPAGSQMSRGEPLRDTARVLSGYCDCIVMRTFGHDRAQEMAQWAEVPVINALTDLQHPCQVLADCFTLENIFGPLKGRKVAWLGDGNNMANSWIEAASLLEFELDLACPEGYDPNPLVIEAAVSRGAKVRLLRDPMEAASGAVAVNTDVWASMGQEDEAEFRQRAFKGFEVDASLMARAAEGAVFMHCLPAHRGEEVSEEVLEGSQSVVWEQAQNRLYIQEAIMDFLLRHSRKG